MQWLLWLDCDGVKLWLGTVRGSGIISNAVIWAEDKEKLRRILWMGNQQWLEEEELIEESSW